MSSEPPNLNEDLQRLQDEGYEIAIRSNYVVLTSIPYVTPNKEVKLGTLMSPLNINASVIGSPSTHQAYFCGEVPCDSTGQRIDQIFHSSGRKDYGDGLISDHDFSAKGPDGHPSTYYTLFQTYMGHICPQAAVLQPGITPRTYKPIAAYPDEAAFCYRDTNAARARIGGASSRFREHKVAVVGCGGTGSYVVDFLSKTPVAEIHLFDGDAFLQHNAFRCPGAAPLSVLELKKPKVDYLHSIYSAMHRGIHVHRSHMDQDGLNQLDGMSFVFLAVDDPEIKDPISAYLEERGIPFIDVGMGIQETDNRLYGQVRTTLSTPEDRACFKRHVSLIPDDGGVYKTNIQISELNALNAAFAVIKWKKHIGFYHDQRNEMQSVYSINDQLLTKDPVGE